MAQSNSEESDLFSIFTDSFVEKPKPKPLAQPDSKPKPPPQPESQPTPTPTPPPKPQPKSQPRPKSRFSSQKETKSTPSQRQDELVRKFPGSKIIRRPNPMEEADDSIYIKFPADYCGNYMQRFYEAARLYGKDCEMNNTSCVYQRIIRRECGIEVHYPAADQSKDK